MASVIMVAGEADTLDIGADGETVSSASRSTASIRSWRHAIVRLGTTIRVFLLMSQRRTW